MTPGLASFVAAGDDTTAWDGVVAGVAEALAQGFGVVPERGGAPGGAKRRTWFDTFDWRLYRAGLLLEYLAARRGGELHLTSATPATPATPAAPGTPATIATPASPTASKTEDVEVTQPMAGWQPSRPHLPPDLPDGPLAARVADLVWPRALLPAVTVSSTVTVSRLLNDDGKTVARLLVEHASVTSGADAALPPRLTITEVRGYAGQARRAARILALSPGVEPATRSLFADALRAIGRRPGDYSNKVDAPITAAMPAQHAAAAILLRLLDTIEANVPGVLHDTDTEFLHDLRVSVRRTRSALKLFGDVLTDQAIGKARLPEEDVARFAAEFKWVGDLTTPTRDLDVHLLGFEETARTLRAAKPDDLEPFREYLEQRRVREYRALARGLRSPRFTALMTQWRAALTKLTAGKRTARKPSARKPDASAPDAVAAAPARSGQPLTAGALAADRTRRAFAKVAKRGAAITPASPHESLHDLRKRCKELRYVLEFFAPLHDPADFRKVIGDLKRLQDCLGEFQDTQVQVEEIRALAAAMLAANEAPAVTLLAMGEVTASLAARQLAARADFERRFAAFAGPDGQRRMSGLLRGGAA
jgi:CHAD domain-containing protein